MIFSIVTADKVQDFEDDVWKMMLLLREVCNVVCAPAISIQQTIILQDKMNDYLGLRITCFPGTVQLDVEKEDSQSLMRYLKTMHHMALEGTNVVFKGIRYTRNMCICDGKNEDDNFSFCTIQKILMNSEGTELFLMGDTHHVT